jgi:hypothetical protein
MQLCIDASTFAPFCKRAFKALYALANSNQSLPTSVSTARKASALRFASVEVHHGEIPSA